MLILLFIYLFIGSLISMLVIPMAYRMIDHKPSIVKIIIQAVKHITLWLPILIICFGQIIYEGIGD